MSVGLQATVTGSDTLVVVAVTGELDMDTADRFHEIVGHAVSGKPARLQLDLSLVTFMDCSGLAVLIEARRHVSGWGGAVQVVSASPQVRRLLEITQLASIFLVE